MSSINKFFLTKKSINLAFFFPFVTFVASNL